jgi:hypothetical protein
MGKLYHIEPAPRQVARHGAEMIDDLLVGFQAVDAIEAVERKIDRRGQHEVAHVASEIIDQPVSVRLERARELDHLRLKIKCIGPNTTRRERLSVVAGPAGDIDHATQRPAVPTRIEVDEELDFAANIAPEHDVVIKGASVDISVFAHGPRRLRYKYKSS